MLQIKRNKEISLCSLPIKMASIAPHTESRLSLSSASWERNGERVKNTRRKRVFASDIIRSFVSSLTRRGATAAMAVWSWAGSAWELDPTEGF